MKSVTLTILTALLALSAGCALEGDELYQTSTVPALMAGVYDSDKDTKQILGHGDFGLGTFDAVNGEMIILDGSVHHIRVTGQAESVCGCMGTPFVTVTYFSADQTFKLDKPMSFDQLTAHIDSQLPSLNYPYAVRVDGTFKHIKARSVPPQRRPYRPLAEVVRTQQNVYEYRDVTGTLVGFRMPAYTAGLNVPGYHFHFIKSNRATGGHVLALTTDTITVGVDDCNSIRVHLPGTKSFANAKLSGSRMELHGVER
jgi:acetolactate decarboxylase